MWIKKKKLTEEEAKLKMADLCSRSEQCEYDIAQKLYKYGLSPSERTRIIQFLIDNRFLDPERFARSFANDKCRFSAWGPFKIRHGLALKRIPSSIISDAIENVDENDWEAAIKRAAQSKSRSLDLTGVEFKENRLKLYKFLLSRGFESSRSKECVKRMVLLQKKRDA